MSEPNPTFTCPILALDGSFRLKKKPVTDLQKGEVAKTYDFLPREYLPASYDICMSYDVSCQLRQCHGHLTFPETDTSKEQEGGKEGTESKCIAQD
ncbi:hypothetical protein B0H11DRAFT_2252030 [Mycena galericulata]|nr:hypothetical protein B0H11DRAFT_2252030 [Mycena galericulata]